MKDEAGGKNIEEFVGLRSKLYSYKKFEGKEEKKCKGIKKYVIKKKISFENYKECLFSEKPQMRKMNVIRSHKHEIFSETVNKIALSANDDKRIIMEDKISTLSPGYDKTIISLKNPKSNYQSDRNSLNYSPIIETKDWENQGGKFESIVTFYRNLSQSFSSENESIVFFRIARSTFFRFVLKKINRIFGVVWIFIR